MHAFVTLFGSLSQMRRRQLLMTLALMLVGATAELVTIGATVPFFTFLLGEDHVAANRLTAWASHLGIDNAASASLLLIGAAIFSAAVRLWLLWASQRFITGVSHDIATATFARMIRQPYIEYVRRNSSEVLASMDKVRDLAAGVIQPIMHGIIAAVMAAFIAAMLFVISPFAAAAAAGSLGLMYIAISRMSGKRLRANSKVLAQSATERTKMIQESMGAIRDILIDGSQSVFEANFRSTDFRFRHALSTNALISQTPRFVIEAAGIVTIVLIALAMGMRSEGMVGAMPVLGALALGAQRLLPLVQQIYSGWSSSMGNLQAAADIAALMHAPALPLGGRTERKLPFTDSLMLRDVSFTYGTRDFALRNINLEIPRGSRVGIIGTTGSGKSTLLDLVMGLLEPTEGEILIDGSALDRETRPLWQAQLAHVPQAIFLTDDSIAANIAFGVPEHQIDIDRVRCCADAAQISRLIEGWPEAYQTKVGERGIQLSGGQRQRVGIARALYKGAALLILDEATSALDDATEAAVMRSIMDVGRDITLLMIAHRHSTLQGCDQVIRLEDGRVVPAA